MTLSEVADLILSPEAEFLNHGNYTNHRGIQGYFMQVKSGVNWCKISVSHANRHADRISRTELDEIGTLKVEPSVTIPVDSISAALKSLTAENTAISPYANGSLVHGIWAEFHLEGNWYMISVSHIDVPATATREMLTSVADEFLRQQTKVVNRP
jgi:hypothetical protein